MAKKVMLVFGTRPEAIKISVDETEDPWVMLKIDGGEDLRFKASEELLEVKSLMNHEMREEIKLICDAVHHAYVESTRDLFLALINNMGNVRIKNRM